MVSSRQTAAPLWSTMEMMRSMMRSGTGKMNRTRSYVKFVDTYFLHSQFRHTSGSTPWTNRWQQWLGQAPVFKFCYFAP